MTVFSEETLAIPVGLGLDTYNHPVNISDGFCTEIENYIARSDRLVTRKGFQPPNSIDTRESYVTSTMGLHNAYARLPNSSNQNWPVAMWGITSSDVPYLTTWALRQFDRDNPAAADSNPGIAEFTDISGFKGACVYLDRFYVLSNAGVEYVTNFNWATGATTRTAISNTYNVFHGIFNFKDRIWGWDDTKIYYTDPPSSPGGYPETWDMNGKFIVVSAGTGLGKIWSIVPIGTKLFIFTGSGLYNVSILGSPINWVVRLMDASVQVNSYQCAYESQGVIYFVDTRGVWVTNGDEIKSISFQIQNIFQEQPATGVYYLWKLVPFNDGLILCRTKVVTSSGNRITSEARLFYTALENIAWTEITFETTTQPGDIIAGFSNVESHVIWAPTNYIVLAHGNSTAAGGYSDLTQQLLAYTGYQDKLRKISTSEEVSAVTSMFLSKIVRSNMLLEKRNKYGYVNYSCRGATSDDVNMTYQWLTERDTNRLTETITPDVVNPKEGLIKIKGCEFFRHLQFRLTTVLSSTIPEYTVLGTAAVIHTHRREASRVS